MTGLWKKIWFVPFVCTFQKHNCDNFSLEKLKEDGDLQSFILIYFFKNTDGSLKASTWQQNTFNKNLRECLVMRCISKYLNSSDSHF